MVSCWGPRPVGRGEDWLTRLCFETAQPRCRAKTDGADPSTIECVDRAGEICNKVKGQWALTSKIGMSSNHQCCREVDLALGDAWEPGLCNCSQ